MLRKRQEEKDGRKRKLKMEKRLERNVKESKPKSKLTKMAPLVIIRMHLNVSCRPILYFTLVFIPIVQNPIRLMLNVS